MRAGAVSADKIDDDADDERTEEAGVGGDLEREMTYGFLPTLLGHQVRKAYSKLFQCFTDTLNTVGLAPGQFSALQLIALNPGLSQMALADATGMDRAAMAPIVNRFAKAGWVRRVRRSDDRRVYSLELTSRGEAVLGKAAPLVESVEKQLAVGLSRDEQKMTRTLLARVADSEDSSERLSMRNEAVDINYGKLPEHLGYQLRRAYSYLFRTFMLAFKSLQLAPGQYSALVLIGLNPGRSQIDLAAASGLDGSTLAPIVDRFVKLGWVRRVRRRSDRRVYALRVTSAGQEILDEARPMIAAREKRLGSALSAREREALLEMLTRLAEPTSR